MKLSKRFRQAAERLDSNHRKCADWGTTFCRIGCCSAIMDYNARMEFTALLKPRWRSSHVYWFGEPLHAETANTDTRVLALLLAAEVMESEGQ